MQKSSSIVSNPLHPSSIGIFKILQLETAATRRKRFPPSIPSSVLRPQGIYSPDSPAATPRSRSPPTSPPMASLCLKQLGGAHRPAADVAGLRCRPRPGLSPPSRVGFRVLASGDRAEPDLSVTVNGLHMPNPFVIGSGPPGTNYTVMKRAFDEGWGAVIAKTVSLEADKVINVTPRYARLRAGANGSAKGQIIGWENIELISDRPLEIMLKEFKQLKKEYPDRILIASIMEEYNKVAWEELIDRVEQSGVDAIEINFSCPHGMPERKMGAAVGQDCALLEEVCGWINAKATIPVWAKMTPNITDITQPARVALKSGCEGVSAINTIMSVMGIDLETLRPEPCVEGYSTPGGYSSKAVHPIALAKVMSMAKMMKSEFDDKDHTLSAIGGVETGGDAAEFILLGADTVQVCTGVMMQGYGLVKKLCAELKDFMEMHNFSTIEDFRGASLQYFTTHTDLVQRQQEAIRQRKAVRKGLQSDKDWTGDGFVKESESMVSN